MNVTENEFLEIIRENEGALKRLCRSYTDRLDERKDLYQDIIIQVWRSLPSFEGNAKVSTWIYRIGVNTAISFNRKKSTRRDYHEKFSNEQPDVNYSSSHVEESDEKRVSKLYAAIGKLNASEKAIVTMYLEEFSYSEIAYAMDITENYVGVKLNRIKTKLSELLGEYYAT